MVLTKSLEEFKNFVKGFVKTLKKGDIVVLSGDLGAGKTTFVKEACQCLGVGSIVTSPTFTFMNEYEGKDFNIYHYDLYRIENLDDIYELGVDENLYSGGISFIEWNKFEDIPKDRTIYVKIDKTANDSERVIEVAR